MGNGMNKVLPGLYVGNYRDSKDPAQLERFEITHILAIHDAARRLHSDKHYLCIMAADTPDQNLSQYFSICNDFIHSARLRGGNVLIHCLAGMSRSVTVAVAYIMSTTELSWKDALKVVRVGRSVANPNVGFQQQLQDFESIRLHEERLRLRERYPSMALSAQDAEACRLTLISYEGLALAREVCEGKCPMGRVCPTGMCRQASKRNPRRKSSTCSTGSLGSSTGKTPPQTPRLLPSAPPSPAMPRSASIASANVIRPRSGPAGLHYYTSSAPPSRMGSRVDLSGSVACSSLAGGGSTSSLSAIGRSAPCNSIATSPRRYAMQAAAAANSAPATPRATPPLSPQHWPRGVMHQLQQQQRHSSVTQSTIPARPGTPQPSDLHGGSCRWSPLIPDLLGPRAFLDLRFMARNTDTGGRDRTSIFAGIPDAFVPVDTSAATKELVNIPETPCTIRRFPIASATDSLWHTQCRLYREVFTKFC